jgi:predicted transposase YbfD/YdcC
MVPKQFTAAERAGLRVQDPVPILVTGLVQEKKAHFVLAVKKNHPTLYEQLRTLPWKQVTVVHYDRSTGHGRQDTRALKVLTVDDLDFPHLQQVARVTRHSTCTTTGNRTRQTVYVVGSLSSRQASPERMVRLVRSQWVIENRLHYVHDVTFGEDASQVRTGHGPRTWRPCGAWRSICSGEPASPTSPRPSVTCPTTPSSARWTSSASHDDPSPHCRDQRKREPRWAHCSTAK